MSCTQWLQQFLFMHARNDEGSVVNVPTGKALYSYRCTEKSYVRLGVLILADLPKALSGHRPPDFEACLCMYAAETFRREHVGSSWAWRTIFDPLGVAVPPNNTMGQWIERGLKYWRREVLRGSSGQHMWLVTIACEGGLPLRLLQHEGAHLRSFFRNILESYHQRRIGTDAIYAIAREHIQRLPKSLRNPEVLHLASTLLIRIIELQRETEGAADPLAQLESKFPNWRSTLPLRLDDSVAEALFKNLMEHSRTLERQATARAGWIGTLRETMSGVYSVTKRLVFPDRVSGVQLQEWTRGASDNVPRWRLLLETQRRIEPIASLTLVPSYNGTDSVYRREWQRREPVALCGEQVQHPHEVLLGNSHYSSPVPLRNSDSWGDSPWVFVPSRIPGEWEWLSEGSGRTAHSTARVAVIQGTHPLHSISGECSKVGELREPARLLYAITGEVEFQTEDGDRYRFTCGAERESDNELQLQGERFHHSRNERAVFRGAPRFFEMSANGNGALAAGELQWRRVGEGGAWSSRMSGCVGRVWIRLLDHSGIERIRRQVDVLPSNFSMQRRLGVANLSGYCELSGIADARVEASCGHGALHLENIADGVRIDCVPQLGAVVTPLHVKLHWPDTQGLELQLNYPQQCAIFQLDGRNLERSAQVTADRLYGLWLHAESPASASRFRLDIELIRGNSVADQDRLGFTELLPPLSNGVLEVSMGSMSDRIRSLLAADDGLGTQVRLTVRASGTELARLYVRYYDMNIVPLEGLERVGIPEEQLARLDGDWRECLSLEILPLFDPGRPPVPLEQLEDGSVGWKIPEALEPGPWWVVGRDRSWARFRPLLLSIKGETGENQDEGSLLTQAVREPDAGVRARILDDVLSDMAINPEHEDWNNLLAFVRLASDFSPNSIDPLRHLIRNPDALVMALLRADESAFSRLLTLADQMPFVWGLVPLGSWQKVTSNYYARLRFSLVDFDGAEDLVWQTFQEVCSRLNTNRHYFSVLCDYLQAQLFPERPLTNSPLRVVRALGFEFLRPQFTAAENSLLSRHEAEEEWPSVPDLLRMVDEGFVDSEFSYRHLTDVQRTVRCAPFVAVGIALRGEQVDDDLVYQLRAVRDFDSEWFDDGYALALTYGLSRLN